jgi:outer membrane receptor protein involved in Fe transport
MARRRISALLGSISLLAFTAPAYAAVETVIVTAEKRSEDVKTVPMSVTVLGGESLSRKAATSFADFINTVPGMSYASAEPGLTSLFLRGINAGGVGATVGTYIDETPYGSSSALANGTVTTPNLDTFDIARVEVLRGPQGTLYGANTLGGLLKFVTTAPSTAGFDNRFEVSGSDLDDGGNGYSVKGMLNVPVGEHIAVRVVGYHDSTSGYIDDPGRGVTNVNGHRSTGGRASVLFDLTDKLSLRLSAVGQNLTANGNNAVDLNVVGPNFTPKYGMYKQQRVAADSSAVRYRVYNATLNWDLDWAALTSATSFGTFHDDLLTDDTGVLGAFVGAHLAQHKFTQEVRLASPQDGSPFEWLIGGYYTNETAVLHQDVLLSPVGPSVGFVQLDSQYVERAVFGDVTYHFTDAFDVQVGGRYSHNGQSALETGLASAGGVSSGNEFTWSVSPRYHLDENTMLYARVDKGWRPGGPNALPPGPHPGVPTSYNADSMINYEAGVKSTLLDGELSLDASIYYIDWSDIQLLVLSGGFGVNTNGGKASSRGAEWSIEWLPIDPLKITFGGAYTDAHLTSPTDPLLVGAPSGARLPWTPRWTTNVDVDYTFDPMGDITPFIGGSWRFIGERKSDFGGFVVAPTPNQFNIPSYNVLDARIGFDWSDWEVELYGKNLSDAKGITQFSATGASAASGIAGTAAYIQPREFGIILRGKI